MNRIAHACNGNSVTETVTVSLLTGLVMTTLAPYATDHSGRNLVYKNYD